LYSAVGGKTPEQTVNALLSCFGTKIFHCMTDPTSCKWASEQVGNNRQWRASGNKNRTGFFSSQPGGDGLSIGLESEPFLRPEAFQNLRAGGPLNSFEVDGIVLLGAKAIEATGRPYLEVVFRQSSGIARNRVAAGRANRFRGLLGRLSGFVPVLSHRLRRDVFCQKFLQNWSALVLRLFSGVFALFFSIDLCLVRY
jgi:hypothetical protein